MDKALVKKITTFRSGPFVLSGMYSTGELATPLLTASLLWNSTKDLPILPNLAARLEEELVRRSIFGTAAIEGNPLSEQQVDDILANPEAKHSPQSADQEIRNLKKAYDLVKSLGVRQSGIPLSEKIVRELHRLITFDIEYRGNTPGQYRNHRVKVGDSEHGGTFTPPKILEDVRMLMREFVKWINGKDMTGLDPIVRAALAHYHLALIHPFGDGNGRTARIIEALLLSCAGMKYVPQMLSNFYYRRKDDYFWAFSNTIKRQDDDRTPFLSFVVEALIDSLEAIKDRITFWIRKFTMRDYYDYLRTEKRITRRQHELLASLLESTEPFSLNDLFIESPFRFLYSAVSEKTARRDLKRLSSESLLFKENGKYRLNWKILE